MKTQTINKVLQFLLIGSLISTAFFGCTKEDEVDGPGTDPEVPEDVEVNSTIAEVLAMYENDKDGDDDFFQVTENMTFAATVISSDETGNVYKYITVQDEAGNGIQVKLNATNLYQSFPQGRKVAIKAEDMYIGNYGGLVQLGGLYNDGLGSIEEDAIADHVILQDGEVALPAPTTLDLSALPDNVEDLYNTLVKVTGVQFAQEGVEYASQENNSTNLDLVNKTGQKIVLRTSKYSNFAGETVPSKSGDITAILTAYNGTLQLTLVSLDDIDFNEDRFDVEIELDGEGTLENPYSIADISTLGTGNDVWVRGFIIGSVDGASIDAGFIPGATENSSASNFILASSKDETDPTNGIPVQLVSGSDVRAALNLKDNADKAGTEVWLFGNIETYFGTPGIKGTSKYSLDGEEEEVEPEPEPDFDGQGADILGSSLEGTTIDFTTYTVASFTEWTTSDKSASINAYGKGKTEAWMISKTALTLEGTNLTAPRLLVTEELKYFTQFDDVQILVSSDYTGTGNPNDATWTPVTTDEERANGGKNILNITFTGTQYVAFKYSAADGTGGGSMSWAVSTVKVGEKHEEGETPVDPEPEPGENLVLNGGFEAWENDTTPEGWAKAENLEKESTIVNEGTYSAKQTGGTKDIAQTLKVEAGKTYIISFAYQVDATMNDGTDARIWSHFRDESSSTLADGHIKGNGDEDMTSSNPSSYLETKAGEWVEFSKEYVAPANAAELYLEFRTYKNAVVYWDSISVEEKL
ncbi:DUF5689 domain-containing protein [Flammeovirga sp. EKP202]|uniref:DUF5689 domain-containing protein n=1 Tax=Flammeovirga sp. EKP202 TaxID=2770592 RepID=UPI00165FFA23|nr:DUF5689 domain-containing protein [Flammeovirga sp. EKP202]MBD0405114.1 hypothetical protein [Flammeovirga sp. EKP202]